MSTRAEREKLALLEEKRLEKEEKKRLLQEKRALRDAKKAEKMETSTMNSSHVGESVENADEEGESGSWWRRSRGRRRRRGRGRDFEQRGVDERRSFCLRGKFVVFSGRKRKSCVWWRHFSKRTRRNLKPQKQDGKRSRRICTRRRSTPRYSAWKSTENCVCG